MNASNRATNLVISFSGALSALSAGTLKAEDLDGALFYFGCTRSHAIDQHGGVDYGNRVDTDGTEKAERSYQTLITAVLKAENAGKVAWRTLDEQANWRQLNELLTANGLPTIEVDRRFAFNYCYPAVVDAVREHALPIKVITNR